MEFEASVVLVKSESPDDDPDKVEISQIKFQSSTITKCQTNIQRYYQNDDFNYFRSKSKIPYTLAVRAKKSSAVTLDNLIGLLPLVFI